MRASLAIVAAVAYALAVLCFRPHPTPGPQLRDFEAYYAAGRTWIAGDNPYTRGIWNVERTIPGVDAGRDELLPFVNPPPLLPLLSLYARLPFAQAAVAWSITLGFALLAILASMLLLLERARDPFAWIAAILAAIAFGPISSDLALGQLALLGIAAVALASLGFARRKPFAAAIATFIAGLQPTFAPILVAWSRNRSALIAQAVATIAFFLAWIGLSRSGGLPRPAEYLRLLTAHGSAEGLTAIQFTPAAIAHGLGATDGLAAAIGWGVAIAAIATAGVIAWRRRDDALAVFCSFCALAPLALGFFHEHDFALLVLPLFVALQRSGQTTRPWVVAAMLLVGIDWLGIAQRPDGASQTFLLAIALTAASLAFVGRFRLRDAWPLAGAAIAIGAATLFARGHALAIWPDAMGTFTSAANASVAQIWHREQAATGLFAPNPLASLLRCLPLAGAALLALLSARLPRVVRDSKRP